MTDDRLTQLDNLYGPILGSSVLWRVLGFSSPDAFRKAVRRGTVPVETFIIPNRRGVFARTTAVASWLSELDTPAINKPATGQ